MSAPLKKARAVYPLEDYASEEEVETDDELIGQTVDIDFDAFRAEDSDFHGIRRLLAQSFRGLNIDISGIADIIISQNYVGSVVRQVKNDDDDSDEDEMDTEDEVFGVSTVINLTSRKDEEPIVKLRSELVEQCQNYGNDSTNTLVREFLGNESKHVGLLISERLVNLPPQFAMPVYDSLVKELEAAKKKSLPYDFTYLVMVCKLYKQQEKSTKKKNKPSLVAQIMWSNPEEEVFEEECIASFEYPVKGDTGLTGKWEEEDAQYFPFRKVLILDGKQLPAILNKELEAAKKKSLPYDFTYLVMVCKLYKQQEKSTKKKNKPSLVAQIMWSNPEEEVFEEECIASFEYPVKGDTGLTGKWEEEDAQYFPFRKVLILDGKQLPSILNKVRQSLSQ